MACPSNHDPLDLVEGDLVRAAIIELGRPSGGMGGHVSRGFQLTAIDQIGGDPGRAEGVVANFGRDPGLDRPAPNHRPGMNALQPPIGQILGLLVDRAEKGRLLLIADAGCPEIIPEIEFEIMVAGHPMLLAAFLMQPEPEPVPLIEEIVDIHGKRRADPREAIDHHADQRPVAQSDQRLSRDAVDQRARLLRRQHRRLAFLDHMLRAAHRHRRVDPHDMAGDQPVEQHADRRELLLDARRRVVLAQMLDIGGDVHRLDVGQPGDPMIVAPMAKSGRRPAVGLACVRVVDLGGEELDEAHDGVVAGLGNQPRDDRRVVQGRDRLSCDRLQIGAHRVPFSASDKCNIKDIMLHSYGRARALAKKDS